MTGPTIVAEVDGGPAPHTWPRTGPLAIDWIAEVPDAVVMRTPPAGDTDAPLEQWESVTASDLRERVRRLARGLVGLGLERGDCLAIMCRTRPEWTLVSWACAYVGVVVVPVYDSSSPAQVEWNVANSASRVLLVEDAALRSASGVDELPDEVRPQVLVVEEGALAEIERAGASIEDARLDERAAAVEGSDLITIVYTSGTTGRPKGCAISHAGFLQGIDGSVAVIREGIDRGDEPRTVLMLPLAHIFGRVVEAAALLSRHTLVHEPDMTHLVAAFAKHRPTYIGSVPRVFQKVYAAASAGAQTKGALAARIFAAADTTALEWAETDSPGVGLRLRHALFDRLVYAKLRAALGGDCHTIISGGAALSTHLNSFFTGVGLEIVEGYGVTEVGVTSVNPPGATRAGTVGVPTPGSVMAVDDLGEILIRTDARMTEYHANPTATDAAFDDGWYRTGDLGVIDDGYVRIIGRSKEIIVTEGGKNVAPVVLEEGLLQHPLIGQAMVVGDNRPFVAALLTFDAEAGPGWARNNDVPEDADLTTHPTVLASIEEHVGLVNEEVSRAESVRTWRLLDREWSIESGELTPTLKIKRAVVADAAATEIEKMYENPSR